jgi:hypothetical protein
MVCDMAAQVIKSLLYPGQVKDLPEVTAMMRVEILVRQLQYFHYSRNCT